MWIHTAFDSDSMYLVLLFLCGVHLSRVGVVEKNVVNMINC